MLTLALRVQYLLVAISCIGWVTNHFTGTRFRNQSDISAAVGALAGGGEVEVWRDPREGMDDVEPVPEGAERDARVYTDHVDRALRWAAARGHGGDSLVVLAGSLYLVADFYRLLQKLGQADEIWGSA